MGKKVAILTTHRANNFGAMLQAYSLVMACRELGADAEILDWRCPYFEWAYHKAWRIHRNPIPAIKHLKWFVTKEKKSRAMFDRFRSSLPLSQPISDKMKLKEVEENYDIFLVGSDQVWNPINSAANPLRFDRSNLLDFISQKKKYAYAASIGGGEISPKVLVPEFVDAWKRFDCITMREHAGAEYVHFLTGKNVETVVDPVLLHNADYWRRNASDMFRSKKIVLLYNIRGFSQLTKIAHDLASENNLKIVDLLIPGLQRGVVNAGPAEFLRYFDLAEYVVTDSFHASAFSVLYGKKLYLMYNNKAGNTNARMNTLFSWVDVKGDAVNDKDSVFFYDCSLRNSGKLSAEIERSRCILSRMINGEI